MSDIGHPELQKDGAINLVSAVRISRGFHLLGLVLAAIPLVLRGESWPL
jgi:hypothetical protein